MSPTPAQPGPGLEPGTTLTDFLIAHKLAEPAAPARWTPLAGGVSSDLWRVDLPGRSLCVKRALARLKVAADWQAPVSRNAYEWAWMRFASRHRPDSVPDLLAHDPEAGVFAMAYLPPERYPMWKGQLLDGEVRVATAAAVGELLGSLHAASAGDATLAAEFATDDNFHALRIEPYLSATAAAHPDLRDILQGLADRTATTHLALVHGDVSPKNILVGPSGPVLLDAECAWYGDPAFDLAFCVNHLLLKSLVVHGRRAELLCSARVLAEEIRPMRRLGASVRPRGAGRDTAAGAAGRARGRQVTGGVPHGRPAPAARTHGGSGPLAFCRSTPDQQGAIRGRLRGLRAVRRSFQARHSLALTRQGVPTYEPNDDAAKGGYVLFEADGGEPEVILIATGSEVQLAVTAREQLQAEGIRPRVVSMPSVEWFEEQDRGYRDKVLPPSVEARVAVEAGIGLTWHKYVGDAGRIVSLEHFGASADGKVLFREFGFTAEAVAAAARETLTVRTAGDAPPLP